MTKETPIMELIDELSNMWANNGNAIPISLVLVKLYDLLPAEREMIEEAYIDGGNNAIALLSGSSNEYSCAEQYYLQTFKSISDEK